jgi:hypothetical protein
MVETRSQASQRFAADELLRATGSSRQHAESQRTTAQLDQIDTTLTRYLEVLRADLAHMTLSSTPARNRSIVNDPVNAQAENPAIRLPRAARNRTRLEAAIKEAQSAVAQRAEIAARRIRAQSNSHRARSQRESRIP